jgi:hypothetical protein
VTANEGSNADESAAQKSENARFGNDGGFYDGSGGEGVGNEK